MLVQGIKKKLDRAGGNWVEELTSVLWSYRTTPRGSIGKNPFTLVSGTEAIILAELGIPSHRILHFNEETRRKGRAPDEGFPPSGVEDILGPSGKAPPTPLPQLEKLPRLAKKRPRVWGNL
ncbi:UNVERIFIED_CONTAM: hypothetical protein Scaly_2429800 [Sesamum calycinum]|uniref:Uncharacterized protein n=1 Tax=Sesamum calycinum TaxID=2727403 RepID=A0AAW2M2N3_9LAMI